MIRVPFEETADIVNLRIQVGKNDIDKSSTPTSKRPYFLIWMHSALDFKGEEKGSSSDIGIAKYKLLEKMKNMHMPVFGEMPFLFAYTAANSWVEFFVINRSGRMIPVSSPNDLTHFETRIECALSSINICRILYHYRGMLPRGYLPMGKEITKDDYTVVLYESHVLKTLKHEPYDFEAVTDIYEAIRRSQIECTIRCTYIRGKWRFKFWPVGFTRIPSSDSEIIAALICVARAFVGLHALGYVHRDVCWPSILC